LELLGFKNLLSPASLYSRVNRWHNDSPITGSRISGYAPLLSSCLLFVFSFLRRWKTSCEKEKKDKKTWRIENQLSMASTSKFLHSFYINLEFEAIDIFSIQLLVCVSCFLFHKPNVTAVRPTRRQTQPLIERKIKRCQLMIAAVVQVSKLVWNSRH